MSIAYKKKFKTLTPSERLGQAKCLCSLIVFTYKYCHIYTIYLAVDTPKITIDGGLKKRTK